MSEELTKDEELRLKCLELAATSNPNDFNARPRRRVWVAASFYLFIKNGNNPNLEKLIEAIDKNTEAYWKQYAAINEQNKIEANKTKTLPEQN